MKRMLRLVVRVARVVQSIFFASSPTRGPSGPSGPDHLGWNLLVVADLA